MYEIHRSLPAVEAVPADVRDAGVDGIVVGGDVFPGPMRREVLHHLRALDIPVRYIRGNGDGAVVNVAGGRESAGRESAGLPPAFVPLI